MADKKSPAELKKEGAALDLIIAAARKKPHNFAMLIGKEGIVLEADVRKPPEVMWRQAKKAGGGSKGAMGTMTVNGKLIELHCQLDDAPGSLPRLAKAFFAERNLPYKVVLVLPEAAPEEADGAQEEAPETGGASVTMRKELVDEFKALSPDLKTAIGRAQGDAARQLSSDAQNFGKLVKGDDLDAARALLDQLRAGVTTALTTQKVAKGDGPDTPKPQKPGDAPATGPEDADAARRTALLTEFAALQPDLVKAAASSNKGAAQKVQMLSQMFAADLSAGDLEKATKTLQVLKKTTQTVLKMPADEGAFQEARDFLSGIAQTLGEDATNLMSSVMQSASDAADAASTLGGVLGDVAKGISEAAHDMVGALTEDDEKNKDQVDDYGLSEDQQMALVHAARNDPAAITAALPVLQKIKSLKLPPAQFEQLMALSTSEPKAYAATLTAMTSIDGGGAKDVSDTAMTAALKKIETTEQAHREKFNEWDENEAKEADAIKAHKASLEALAKAVAAEKAAADALKAFRETLPDDLSTLTPAERATATAEATRLTNEHGAAKTAATNATTAEATAQAAVTASTAAFTKTKADYRVALTARDDAIAENKALEDKRDLLDALNFGALSDAAATPLDEDAKVKMIEAYGKAPDVGQEALALIEQMDDPSLITQNVGNVVDRLAGGFADKKGKQLEIEKPDGSKGPPSEAAGNAMAISALKLGASRGQEYFDGFNAYMDSGAQLKKDPCGGTDLEPGDSDLNLDAVAQKRSAMMADAVVQRDGSVDFEGKRGKEAMDHILYHPGSLQTYAPHAISEIEKTQKLFTDPATSTKANEIIADTKVAGRRDPQRSRARRLVADTTGKSARRISDNDAKESVLSAMMTPLSQGPVGSCFSTAPVRRLKESEPLNVMEKFSDIATKGTVQMADVTQTMPDGSTRVVPGTVFPANMSAHPGQNPIMRSLEYTIADAAANAAQSGSKLNDTLKALGTTNPPGGNLSGIQGLLNNPTDWAGTGFDPVTLQNDEGVEGRIWDIIDKRFKYVYNAAPGSKRDRSSGGGDGRSSDGGYQVYFDGNQIKDKASYVKAMTTIALEALPSTATQTEIDSVKAHVTNDAFVKAIIDNNDGDLPWSRTAGFEDETSKVLRGATPVRSDFINEAAAPSLTTEAALDRSEVVLTGMLATMDTMTGDMALIGTEGDDAMHAFNALPKHPSLDKIKGPGSVAKIQAELLDPGREISERKLPAAKAGKIFDAAIRKLSASDTSEHHDLLALALDKRPTEDMSPKELDAHLDTVLEDFKNAVAKDGADAWRKEQSTGPAVVADALYYVELARQKGQQDMRADNATAGALASEIELPEFIVADLNWGDAASQQYFLFAPDPATGKVRMWEKNSFDGTLVPATSNWTDAKWNKIDG